MKDSGTMIKKYQKKYYQKFGGLANQLTRKGSERGFFSAAGTQIFYG
jgi:hypothetical protein